MGQGSDHGVVRDDLERVDILDEDIAGDVLELNIVEEASHLLAELGWILIAIVLAPHQSSLKIKSLRVKTK